jgi:purine-binding chemotaxis protein CheW
MSAGAGTHDLGARRRAAFEELRALEREYVRARAQLLALGPGAPLPGLHLLVGITGSRVLLPGHRVAEVARVVACDPIPSSPPWVLGSFVWRGRPAVAVDLGERLGSARATSLDALMVILDGTPTLALVVEEIRGLVEDPLVAEREVGDGAPSVLVLGACRVDEEAVPVLVLEALEREVEETS